MASFSTILAEESPWMEEQGRLQSMGSPRVGHDRESKHRYRVHRECWQERGCLPVRGM